MIRARNPTASLAACAGLALAVGGAAAGEAAGILRLEIEGQPRAVSLWTTERCSKIDVPDAGLRAFRRHDGMVVAFASHYQAIRFIGSNVPDLKKDCRQVFVSSHNSDPAAHDDETWIAATWTDDGRTVAAIGHHEYHGEKHAGRCDGTTPRQCRYGVLTLLVSRDGGGTFRKAADRPIAAVPVRFARDQGRDVGFFQPSNIFAYQDHKYVFVRTSGGGAQPAATCLMRARDPAEPHSWQLFDGREWRLALFDPYRDDPAGRPICAQISRLNGLVWSVGRHEENGLFVAVLTVVEPGAGDRLATSTSRDLMQWSVPVVVPDIRLGWNEACASEAMLHYPALIDPRSQARNFDTVGDAPWLFLSRLNRSACRVSLDRDLVVARTRLRVDRAGSMRAPPQTRQ